MKKLLIESCNSCPFQTHGGGFGLISYKPYCNKIGMRKLPYTENASNGRVTAHATGIIPDWCPLENA